MSQAPGFLASSIGRKVVMAVTGAILFAFVVAHLIGNLQVFLGAEAFNRYAVFLREFLALTGLGVARIGLLVAAVLHVWSATSLTLESRRARPEGYREQKWKESTYASRTMRWSGVILLLFVIYHLLHFTTGTVHPRFIEGDVYFNFIEGFRSVPVSLFYIFAMLALGLHLQHGLWSMFQTLGVSHPRSMRIVRVGAWIFAALIVIGNITFPIAVLAGIVK